MTARGEDFWIDGRPTYAWRVWEGRRSEGLLLNARMVQATFDDLNLPQLPLTRHAATLTRSTGTSLLTANARFSRRSVALPASTSVFSL